MVADKPRPLLQPSLLLPPTSAYVIYEWSRLDVLIHNTVGSTVKQCKLLELANQLWCRGIRCSISDPGSTMDDVAG